MQAKILSLSDAEGNTISWASAGELGFKGSRKSTPFAAQMAAETAAKASLDYGLAALGKISVYKLRRRRFYYRTGGGHPYHLAFLYEKRQCIHFALPFSSTYLFTRQAKTLVETFYAAAAVNQFLLTGVKRMALGTNFNTDIRFR